jgi:hypothetical protein
LTETATPGDRIENWDIRSRLLSPIARVLRSDDETRSIAIRMLVNPRRDGKGARAGGHAQLGRCRC